MIQLASLHLNEKNPRKIGDEEMEQLKKSIDSLPKMLRVRPIVIDKDRGIVGGNQRFKALQALGYTEIPNEWVADASDFTEEELKEFLVKDNLQAGEWDWDKLMTDEWNPEDLRDWGLDAPEWSAPEFEPEEAKEKKEKLSQIVFKYPYAEFLKVTELLNNAREQLGLDTNEETLVSLLGEYQKEEVAENIE